MRGPPAAVKAEEEMSQQKIMELYINNTWTQCYDDVCVAEALAWSENGNHVTIYATGLSVDEAQSKLIKGLSELKLTPQAQKESTIREDIPPNPQDLSKKCEQRGASPRSYLDRLEQVVDKILAEVREPA